MISSKPDHAFWWACAASFAAAILVVLPFCFLGQASGHDFQFHVASWADVAQQWRSGVVFPRWAAWANHGFGEPRFIFYPPLSWCVGAALGLLLPWSLVPGAFIVLCLVFSGISMFRLARAWLSPLAAVAASVIYAANPYQLFVAYVRSDFAELLAAALFPLAIHYALRCIADSSSDPSRRALNELRHVALLAVTYGVIWLANAPAAVIVSYALAFLFVLCAILRRSARTIVAGLVAFVLGLLLAAFYIVPAVYEQTWVNIGQINSAGFLPAENFLFTQILDPEHNLVNLQISTIAVFLIAFTGIAALVSHRRAKSSYFIWSALFALTCLSVFLMFSASGGVWRYAPELKFLQFPWRWLLIVSIGFAFFMGEVVAASRWRLILALSCAVLLNGTGFAMTRITYWDSDDLDDVVAAVSNGQGYDGAYEYCPSACDPAALPANPPPVAILPEQSEGVADTSTRQTPTTLGSVSVEAWQPERKTFRVDTPIPARAEVRLLNYPAWNVRVNGVVITPEADPETEQMLVPVPAGKSRVEIRFARTIDRVIGGAISALAALVTSGLLYLEWRKRRRDPL